MNFGRYFYKPVDDVRNDLIGAEITDIEQDGRAIYLKGIDGRDYAIDTTGEKCVVHAFNTVDEDIEFLYCVIRAIASKLSIDDEELQSMLDE